MSAVETSTPKRPRLKFIDMARSCAILLMLEGHFTGAALGNEWRNENYILYKIWHNVHGLTSPLFFTVTGLIFVYLLSADNRVRYFANQRVKKGFKRVAELLFWGYFIQFNLWSVIKSFYYQSEFHFDWFYAFHVLQSIAVGIFLLLVVYGIYKWINRGALYWYYFISALLLFTGYAIMKHYIQQEENLVANHLKDLPTYWPQGAPKFIQNMFYGPFSDFSFVRYSGYTILGGMLGSIIRTFEFKAKEWWFGTLFIVIGLVISIFIQTFFHSFDSLLEHLNWTKEGIYELNATSFVRFGQVMTLLGILMLIDKYVNVRANLFLKIGQNTLPIYVVHVIILYGGIFGIGLKPYAFDQNLDPWTSIAISLAFIVLFSLMVKHIEPLEARYNKVMSFFRLKK